MCRSNAGARHDALKAAATYHSKTARREDLSEQIAVAASKLLETPEEQLPSLRLLLELALDSDAVVRPSLTTSLQWSSYMCLSEKANLTSLYIHLSHSVSATCKSAHLQHRS